MSFTQLHPPIPMETEKGSGYAIAIIDYSAEFDLYWVVALDATGEIWILGNPHVRLQKNYTLGRNSLSTIKEKQNEVINCS